jgi:hypothetical protein
MSAHASEKDAAALDEKAHHEQAVPENAKIVEAENTDLALALATGPQLKPFSIRSIQLYLILLVAFMGSLANGFDGSGEHTNPCMVSLILTQISHVGS